MNEFLKKLDDNNYYHENRRDFYNDLCQFHGVNPEHEGVYQAYSKAWEVGHSNGYSEVNYYFEEFLQIVTACEKSLKPYR